MIEEGTVVQATLRPEDLIPAFMLELVESGARGRVLGDDLAATHARAYCYSIDEMAQRCADRLRVFYGDNIHEEMHELIDALIDALNEVAPEDLYFGAHPGDGSDFGFWSVEFLEEC